MFLWKDERPNDINGCIVKSDRLLAVPVAATSQRSCARPRGPSWMKPAHPRGPDALSLREAARRVGVSTTAAYRHFANKELLAFVAAEGFRELAAAMETGATESDRLGRVGLAYFDFALQKRGLFRLMFGPILVERGNYPELNEAASAVFGLLQRIAVSADEWPREDDWGLVMACSRASSPRRAQEVAVCRSCRSVTGADFRAEGESRADQM